MTTTHNVVDSAALYTACGSSDATEQAEAYLSLWRYLYRVALFMSRSQPDGDALAQDCAQRALLRIHQQQQNCQEPRAFHAWARRIVSNLVIDELRRRRRLEPLVETMAAHAATPAIEQEISESVTAASLRQLLHQAPISDRSRRLVIGRYLDDLDDHYLAQVESGLVGQTVLPSHVQVTRAKNIGKLRQWPLLRNFLESVV